MAFGAAKIPKNKAVEQKRFLASAVSR